MMAPITIADLQRSGNYIVIGKIAHAHIPASEKSASVIKIQEANAKRNRR